jgi:PKHD-type hydroxylase
MQSWPFKLDNSIGSYAYWDNAFTPFECQRIINIGNEKGLISGEVFTGHTDYRKSKISWLFPNDNLDWAFKKIEKIVTELNQKYFQFDLFGMIEGFQFTKYSAPVDSFKRHIDAKEGINVRKLSISVQLSNPKDYVGGDLNLWCSDEPVTANKQQGCLVLFPSYMLHEVTPVTEGTRYSLVSWVTGAPFR